MQRQSQVSLRVAFAQGQTLGTDGKSCGKDCLVGQKAKGDG